ncbi:MAG: CheR family methyltransferase [Bacteroidales bacterium]
MISELENIATFLLSKYGLDISIYDESFLQNSIEKRRALTHHSDINNYSEHLMNSESETNSLLESLNINFSEFFRNPVTFAYLEQIILPLLIEKKRKSGEKEIRIWSAACAAGQEAYSIAILCDELLDPKDEISCLIFATDINPSELEKGQQGIYSANAVSKVSLNRIQSYFKVTDDSYAIIPALKTYVDFSVFDLLHKSNGTPSASIFGNFDLVICCNLLFYYKPEIRKRILEKTGASLTQGGYLITGESEREIIKGYFYQEVFAASAIFQK